MCGIWWVRRDGLKTRPGGRVTKAKELPPIWRGNYPFHFPKCSDMMQRRRVLPSPR